MTDLATCVAELQEAGVEEEKALFERIRELALADEGRFLDAWRALPDASSRADAMEPFALENTFDPRFGALVERLFEDVVGRVRGETDPSERGAVDLTLSLYTFIELEIEKVGTALADRLYDRALPAIDHPHPDVRALVVELVACW